MCLSKVYINSNGESKEVMREVAYMEAKDDGFLFFNLFGENIFIKGTLRSVDFIDENSVILDEVGDLSPEAQRNFLT